ncbi:hypothetical protein LTR56_026623, partial [Elasticomyces elasticus]
GYMTVHLVKVLQPSFSTHFADKVHLGPAESHCNAEGRQQAVEIEDNQMQAAGLLQLQHEENGTQPSPESIRYIIGLQAVSTISGTLEQTLRRKVEELPEPYDPLLAESEIFSKSLEASNVHRLHQDMLLLGLA